VPITKVFSLSIVSLLSGTNSAIVARMNPKSMYLASVALAGLSCVPLLAQKPAQDQSAHDTQAFVEGPVVRLPGVPGYLKIWDALVVSSPASASGSVIPQPPTALETETAFHIEYARANAAQLNAFPASSPLVSDIGSTGVIDYRLNHCQVLLAEWPRKQ
jgi:hypothetical protein